MDDFCRKIFLNFIEKNSNKKTMFLYFFHIFFNNIFFNNQISNKF